MVYQESHVMKSRAISFFGDESEKNHIYATNGR